MMKIYTNIDQTQPAQDLFKTVPVPPAAKPQPVEIPGVLNQTRNLYKPYTGTENKDNNR